jgi:ABC-type Mn2+/Zn2+ transport system permease subunit
MIMLDVLQEDWAIRALLASMAVGLSCGILGAFLVLRNMSMIGDALSHAILPGIVLAFFVFGPENTWGFFLGAVVAGWLSSFLITWIQSKLPTKNDAAIGIVFTCMFSLGVIGISYLSSSQHVHIDLKDYLFGNVLGVSDDDLMISFSVTLIVIAGVLIFYRSLFLTTFQEVVARTMGVKVEQVHYMLMLLLSFAVVSALQTVGVILVVAMLITPASTALLFFKRLNQVIICAACLGVGIAIGGFFISYAYNFPPGPSMAVLATLIYVSNP